MSDNMCLGLGCIRVRSGSIFFVLPYRTCVTHTHVTASDDRSTLSLFVESNQIKSNLLMQKNKLAINNAKIKTT